MTYQVVVNPNGRQTNFPLYNYILCHEAVIDKRLISFGNESGIVHICSLRARLDVKLSSNSCSFFELVNVVVTK